MKKHIFEISGEDFLFDGEKFYIASGDVHYFRIHPAGWRRRLELMKDFGLNTVETYVPWNLHEPKKGEFNFEGICDLEAFIRLCDEMGFKVLLRPAPYICSECDMGGIPSWILHDRTMTVRAYDKRWLKAVSDYYKVLCNVFRPYLCTNGGPIIMVAIENEYGFKGQDRKYLEAIRDLLIENGIDVPLFTTDPYGGSNPSGVINGSLDGILEGINYRSTVGTSQNALAQLRKHHPGFPKYVGEFWSGRQIWWFESYKKRDPKETAESYREALELGAHVNFYMFCGGTNFGFYNGAVYPGEKKLYTPQATSYDENSLVSENGEPTEAYFLCRDVLDDFLGKPLRPHIAPRYKAQTLDVKLTEYALLWDNLDNISEVHTIESAPRYMEDLGQDYGYILYRVKFDALDGYPTMKFNAGGVKDYAAIYQNGKYIDYWLRDRKEPKTNITFDTDTVSMDILTENLGRSNNAVNLENNRKGINGYFAFDECRKNEVEIFTLPMKELSKLKYESITDKLPENSPVFLKGSFDAEPGIDTFFSFDGFEHGFVMINGFNVGRFLPYGPQRTLYIPGELLKEKDNTIEIFDLSPKSLTARLVGEASLEMEIDNSTFDAAKWI